MKFQRIVVSLVLCCTAAGFVRGQEPLDDGAIEGSARNEVLDVDLEAQRYAEEEDAVLTDATARTLELVPTNCYAFTFSGITDEFPEDIHYTLLDETGGVIWEEQPWGIDDQNTQFAHTVCLDIEGCYTFVIYDNEQYQDG